MSSQHVPGAAGALDEQDWGLPEAVQCPAQVTNSGPSLIRGYNREEEDVT